MKVDGFRNVALGVDGTSVILEDNNKTARWSISLNQSRSTTDDGTVASDEICPDMEF